MATAKRKGYSYASLRTILSPDDFCRVERISKGTLYELWRQGIGPEFYLSGNRKRIPHQARLEWQRRRMAAAQREGK
jgi:hypothetical protein